MALTHGATIFADTLTWDNSANVLTGGGNDAPFGGGGNKTVVIASCSISQKFYSRLKSVARQIGFISRRSVECRRPAPVCA
jgi:hypothetical protein